MKSRKSESSAVGIQSVGLGPVRQQLTGLGDVRPPAQPSPESSAPVLLCSVRVLLLRARSDSDRNSMMWREEKRRTMLSLSLGLEARAYIYKRVMSYNVNE